MIILRQADIIIDNYPEVEPHSIDLYYTDPPWMDGLVKMFHTVLRKDTGQIMPERRASDLLRRVFEIADEKLAQNGVLVIEYAVNGAAEVDDAFRYINPHLRFIGCYENFYRSVKWRPMATFVYARGEFNLPLAGGWKGTHFLRYLIDGLQPRTMLDTFAGLGVLTSCAAKEGVAQVYGFELNRIRLEKAKRKVNL